MEKCTIENCDRKHLARGYCSKHLARYYKFGYVKERSNRDKNEIEIVGDIAKITLYRYDSIPTTHTIIDLNDLDKVKDIKWALSSGYARSHTLHTGLHNIISGFSPVDHINGDRLDNRKCNLRPATLKENNQNVSGHKNSSCVSKGVCRNYDLKNRTYLSVINGHKIGRFETEDEAAWMYDQYAIQIFGEFARLNNEYI